MELLGGKKTAAQSATVKPASGAPQPFRVNIPQERLDEIRHRVAAFPWDTFADPASAGDWTLGPPTGYMRELCAWWATGYDWRAQERAINALPQFFAKVEGLDLHFVHEPGSGPSPRPLLLLHGWPYSFHSFTPLIARLAHPERFGGRVEDAFSIVVPSLPGYAFSGRPAGPMGPRQAADLMHELMTGTLGCSRYLAHGGDWGGYLASLLGLNHASHVAGVHLTMVVVRAGESVSTPSPIETDFLKREAAIWDEEGAYARLEASRPLSLAYAMADSPVGAAAYMVEKFFRWSDRRTRPFQALFTRDQLLTEIMLYTATDAFDTSIWMGAADVKAPAAVLPPGRRVEVPTAIAAFPDPVFPTPPRALVERSYNVVRYTKMGRGGHYPFYEAPDLLIDDLRAFARSLGVD